MANARSNPRDRILLVESDPAVSDLIGRQALQSVGYQVQVAADAATAISRALQWAPDLILVDLNLPGLSGKDLLVALASQGIRTPVVIIAQRGMEADLIQTFRLGAADYILLPAREAEVVNAVNRVLQQVHDRRERERLAQQLQQANQDLQARVRELTTIFALGKAMTSITDQALLLEKILDGAVHITQADVGWFLLREDTDKPFVVVAQHNLPPALGVRNNYPWDDGISSLVAMSGEILTIHGQPLKRFKISSLGLSALIAPIKAQKKVIGLLVMMRRKAEPFGQTEQHLLDALSDYASISLVNARLFRAYEERARSLQNLVVTAQTSEKVKNEILHLVKQETVGPLQCAHAALDELARDPLARLRPEQRQKLSGAIDAIQQAREVLDAADPQRMPSSIPARAQINLVEMIQSSVSRLQPVARRTGMQISTELPAEPVIAQADPGLLDQIIDGALCSGLRFGANGGHVTLRLEKSSDGQAYLRVRSTGRMLTSKDIEKAFEENEPPLPKPAAGAAAPFRGLGIRLSLLKDIITRQHGEIWLESQPLKGTTLHIRLPVLR